MEAKKLDLKMNSVAIKEIAVKMGKSRDKIKDIFDNVDLLMINVKDNDNWKGQTNEAYFNRYMKLKEYFPKILDGLDIYTAFLNNAGTSYEDKEADLNKNIENNDSNLNVN